jgi:hypothetical protein
MEHYMPTTRSWGLRIQNIDIQNHCLLSKWLFELINEDGLWQQILKKKYVKDSIIAQVQHKQGDSHFWSGLVKVKDEFLKLGHFCLNNGCNIRFWEDKWLGNYPLKELYPSLSVITRKKHISVASIFS